MRIFDGSGGGGGGKGDGGDRLLRMRQIFYQTVNPILSLQIPFKLPFHIKKMHAIDFLVSMVLKRFNF